MREWAPSKIAACFSLVEGGWYPKKECFVAKDLACKSGKLRKTSLLMIALICLMVEHRSGILGLYFWFGELRRR